jgi:hypothetical protein
MALRGLVAQALKGCSEERQQVASELSIRTHDRITKRMLDDWASPSKKGLRFPASLVKDFCEVTGNDGLALAIVGRRLRELIELGERVCSVRTDSERLLQIAGQLRALGCKKTAKVRPTRKA